METEDAASTPQWRIELFGGLSVRHADGSSALLRSQKAGALLAYLAFHSERPHPREKMADLFWPEADSTAGRMSLAQVLTQIRRVLKDADPPSGTALLADRLSVRLDPTAVTTDVAEFEAALRQAKSADDLSEKIVGLQRAVELYRGELLPGFYEEWIPPESARLEAAYLRALGQLVRNLVEIGDADRATAFVQRWTEADPLNEEAHRSLLELLIAAGDRTAALRHYRLMERTLKREWDTEPSEATRALLNRITHASIAPRAPLISSPRNNLPRSLTSFIGREQERKEIRERLAQSPLLTLTGAGGCGKTRLALEAGREALKTYPNGVWFVELAALSNPDLVPKAVATAFGLQEDTDGPLQETLILYLKPKSLLLILDNCEHLLLGCATLVEEWLQACPRLQILATSREGLNILGERRYRVPSLTVPDTRTPQSSASLLNYEATRLFVDRAVAVEPKFTPTDEDAPFLAEISRRLDGIPLAIELAAARMSALSLPQIAERLEDRFRLLTGGSRTAIRRHQTLRALIDWSYDLLSPGEQKLLRRLSVFAGGFTLEAVEAVCDREGDVGTTVLDGLESLVEKSLIQKRAGTKPRFTLLETIRAYARDRLWESDEGENLRRWHAEFFLELSETAYAQRQERDAMQWMERQDEEKDNLREALGWAEENREAELGLRLTGLLGDFWLTRGYWTEGRERLARFLSQQEAVARTNARARALGWLGMFNLLFRDVNGARTAYVESLDIYQEVGTRLEVANALHSLGGVCQMEGDFPTLFSLREEGLRIRREENDRWGVAHSLIWIADSTIWLGDWEEATALLNESLLISREMGYEGPKAQTLFMLSKIYISKNLLADARSALEECLRILREQHAKRGVADALQSLGWVLQNQNDRDGAEILHRESLELRREIGDRYHEAESLKLLGNVAEQRGDLEGMASLFIESLKIRCEVGNPEDVEACLRGLIRWAAAVPHYERAVRWIGTVERDAVPAECECASSFGEGKYVYFPLLLTERDDYERAVAAARGALGEADYAAAWEQGRTLAPEQVLADAQALAASPRNMAF